MTNGNACGNNKVLLLDSNVIYEGTHNILLTKMVLVRKYYIYIYIYIYTSVLIIQIIFLVYSQFRQTIIKYKHLYLPTHITHCYSPTFSYYMSTFLCICTFINGVVILPHICLLLIIHIYAHLYMYFYIYLYPFYHPFIIIY